MLEAFQPTAYQDRVAYLSYVHNVFTINNMVFVMFKLLVSWKGRILITH